MKQEPVEILGPVAVEANIEPVRRQEGHERHLKLAVKKTQNGRILGVLAFFNRLGRFWHWVD